MFPQHSLHNDSLMSCRNSLGKLINQDVFPCVICTLTTLLRNRNYCAFWLGHEIKACRVHRQRVNRLSNTSPAMSAYSPFSSCMRVTQLILEHP